MTTISWEISEIELSFAKERKSPAAIHFAKWPKVIWLSFIYKIKVKTTKKKKKTED